MEVLRPDLYADTEPSIKSSPNRWTPEQEKELLVRYNNREQYRAIASALGKNINTIQNKIWSLGIKRQRYGEWSESDLLKLGYMLGKGYSVKRIAKELNRTYQSVNSKIYTSNLSKIGTDYE
jgi:hypothetical protein